MMAVRGSAVDIPTQDGMADAYFVHPDGHGRHPAVLLYQDAFGPRPALNAMADRLAAEGYAVLVPNVFYRQGRSPVVSLPAHIDHDNRGALFAELGPLMQGLTPDLVVADAHAYLGWLADCPQAADGPVGITGYCMGARLALYTAGSYPDRVAAVGGFHGGRLATDQPDSPHLAAATMTAEAYFGHADQDESMPPAQQEFLEKALTEAGVIHRCEVYQGAGHGYTQSDTSEFDPEATERHWAALLDLFGRTLRG
ncbi:hydrolase [Streptomyces xanthochromogenes]|uniref:dienelactone hydrolase family protein n=1 Tax=Streptomyces xanthochromogenes TaxID=67384 RepID=UPI001677CD61|nr:dienelactone hydrolase family protein [Streptomyces xanthochromogenes]GHB73568.1 hydrolase [Streptomyces xanthochromogenes]